MNESKIEIMVTECSRVEPFRVTRVMELDDVMLERASKIYSRRVGAQIEISVLREMLLAAFNLSPKRVELSHDEFLMIGGDADGKVVSIDRSVFCLYVEFLSRPTRYKLASFDGFRYGYVDGEPEPSAQEVSLRITRVWK